MTIEQIGLVGFTAIIVAAIVGDKRTRNWTAASGYATRHSIWPTVILVLSCAAVFCALLALPNSDGITPVKHPSFGLYVIGGLFLVIPPVVGFGRNAVFVAAFINGVLLCIGYFVLPGVEKAVALGLSAGMWPWVVVLGALKMVMDR